MKINDCFKVEIRYRVHGKSPETLTICPSDFFDDGARNYSEDEWRCDLPWDKLTLEDYLIPKTTHATDLESIILTITDLRKDVIYRIAEQRWENHRIITTWDNLTAKSNPDHVILEIGESTGKSFHILRFHFLSGALIPYSHNLHSESGIERSYKAPIGSEQPPGGI